MLKVAEVRERCKRILSRLWSNVETWFDGSWGPVQVVWQKRWTGSMCTASCDFLSILRYFKYVYLPPLRFFEIVAFYWRVSTPRLPAPDWRVAQRTSDKKKRARGSRWTCFEVQCPFCVWLSWPIGFCPYRAQDSGRDDWRFWWCSPPCIANLVHISCWIHLDPVGEFLAGGTTK